ncbi:MAG: DUF3267 domain-containing protein [Bacteroidota bacterium]|nr:DUF3267 domain-containing protein [Bacteroidota bacterium]
MKSDDKYDTMTSRIRPDAETLQKESGYRKILELDFSDIIPFVISNIRKPGLSSLFYIIINAASLLFIFFFALWSVRTGQFSAGGVIWRILAGLLAGSLLVIPPHELLHGLAYRILGARKIKFGVDFQQFIFYVTADHFPISKRELAFLAMTPFVMINLVLILITAVWVPQITLLSASLLLSHNVMCIGDFAMISYAYSHSHAVYTYDDTEKKKSYFFERES